MSAIRHAVAVADNKSYVNACKQDKTFAKIFQYKSELETVGVNRESFRKSEQWFGLQRQHASIVAYESKIAAVFRKVHIKFADEHYIPTVLAHHHLSSQTSCGAGVTYTNWGWGFKTKHPKVSKMTRLQFKMI
jgi:hypothetical protein